MTCAATRDRSDPKERRDTRLLTVIGFPHAEDMAIRATRRVADDDHSIAEHAEANHPLLTVILTYILYLEAWSAKDKFSIFEVQASQRQGLCALLRIVCDGHVVSVSTSTYKRKGRARRRVF